MPIDRPFWFLRHGETHWNAEGRIQGRLETALSDVGRAQATAAARRLACEPIARIVSSPLARAYETALRVAARQRLEVERDTGLAECGLGAMEGGRRGKWLREYWSGRATPEGAEPFERFAERAFAALKRAVDRDGVLVVAHGGVWRALRAHVRVEPEFWIANGAPIRVDPRGRIWRAEPLDGLEVASMADGDVA